MYLLDTNVVSELRRPSRTNRGVLAWASTADPSTLFISAVTLMEIRIGVLRLERRDPHAASHLRRWLEGHVLPSFAGRTIPIDGPVAMRCATLHVPDGRPDRDSFIAATALSHRLAVVTRNVRDFEPTGVEIINPWT